MTKAIDRESEIDRLSEDSLRDRLKLAEEACVTFGWCASHRNEGPREEEAHDAWMRWAVYVGQERTGPRGNSDLDRRVKDTEARWAELKV